MLNRLGGQPESYEKKYGRNPAPPPASCSRIAKIQRTNEEKYGVRRRRGDVEQDG